MRCLTDFDTFKPANLPDDEPSDFQYYFDTTGRTSCYISRAVLPPDIKSRVINARGEVE